MDTGSFILLIKREDTDAEIAKDLKTKFGSSIVKLKDHCLEKKNKKVIVLMKDQVDRKAITKFVGLK